MSRSIPARAPLLAALAVALLVSACGGDDDPTSAPRAGTDTASTTTSSSAPTTEATTSSAPTTSTTPPPTGPPAPVTVPPGVDPVAVLVAGDSVGYTIGLELPDGITGVRTVDNKALFGCGLLTTGERPPEAVALGVPATYDGCAEPIEGADADGLAAGPDVVLLVTGAWERSPHVRDGQPTGPGDAAWTEGVHEALLARVQRLSSTGVPVGLWVDPCGADAEDLEAQAWYRDEVIEPVAEETAGAGTFVVDPSEAVCDGDVPRTIDGLGNPRPEDGQHWSTGGAAWLWTTWLGPTLAAEAA